MIHAMRWYLIKVFLLNLYKKEILCLTCMFVCVCMFICSRLSRVRLNRFWCGFQETVGWKGFIHHQFNSSFTSDFHNKYLRAMQHNTTSIFIGVNSTHLGYRRLYNKKIEVDLLFWWCMKLYFKYKIKQKKNTEM